MADTFKPGDHVKIVNVNQKNTYLGITGTIVREDGDCYLIQPDPSQPITQNFVASARVMELLAPAQTPTTTTAASSAVYDFKDIARRIGRRQ